ncbi:hypothetical protein ACFL96_13390 [Thermoproteota archaeon]
MAKKEMTDEEKIVFLEGKLLSFMTVPDNDSEGYGELVCCCCGTDKKSLFMQRMTSEVYCQECMIYKT